MNNQQAINLLKNLEQSLDDYCELNDEGKTAFRMGITALELFGNAEQLPSAQPEHLTDDDFETIRIHLSAYKELLCNQHRWKEAEEYQRIIDRFMLFASAQTKITRCGDCKYCIDHKCYERKHINIGLFVNDNDFCKWGIRKPNDNT